MIEVHNIHAGHGAGPDVVDGVSLTAEPGSVTTLIGPNGCGKSTLLKTMTHLLTPRSGRVCVDGRDLHSLSAKEAARTVALLPQHPAAPAGLTVGELVSRGRHPYRRFGRGAEGTREIEAALERTGVAEFVSRDIAELSGGQRQRVWLAMALAQSTPVLLLDEPTTYLDPAHAVSVLELARELARDGLTVVMVLHDLMLAGAYSDHMVVMRDGRVMARGIPREAITRDSLAQAYGLDAEVWDDPRGTAPIVVPRGVV